MEPFWAKIVKMHFWLQSHFFRPKVNFGPKMHFWRKKWFLGAKCDFEQKVPFGTLTNSHTLTPFRLRGRPDPKKWIFAPKSTFWLQNAFWAQKCISGAKVHFLRKNALLRPHAADAYKTNGILTKMEPFSPQKRFWTQKCILEPRINFGPIMRKIAPKFIFYSKVLFPQKWPKG